MVNENKNLERLSLDEILEKYPDQWVGLTDMEWEPDNSATVKTAVVKYINTDKDSLLEMQIDTNGAVYSYHTGRSKGLYGGY